MLVLREAHLPKPCKALDAIFRLCRLIQEILTKKKQKSRPWSLLSGNVGGGGHCTRVHVVQQKTKSVQFKYKCEHVSNQRDNLYVRNWIWMNTFFVCHKRVAQANSCKWTRLAHFQCGLEHPRRGEGRRCTGKPVTTIFPRTCVQLVVSHCEAGVSFAAFVSHFSAAVFKGTEGRYRIKMLK